jgi:hypothetical protein
MKPIFVIRLPQQSGMEENIEMIKTVREQFKHDPISEDYHLLIMTDRVDGCQFECFNTPSTETEIAELQQYVIEKIELLTK